MYGDIKLATATNKLYLDGGSNTFIHENAADTIGFATNGVTRFTMNGGGDLYVSNKVQAGGNGIEIWDSTHGFKQVLAKDSTYTKLLNNDGTVMMYMGDSGDAQMYYQANEHRFRNLAGSAYYARIGSGYIRGEGGGSVGTPQFSFQNDPNTGMYSLGADDLGFSAGGQLKYGILNGLNRFYSNVVVGPNNNNSKPYIQYKNGYDTASTPSYSWYYDNGCGIGHPAGSVIAFSTGSNERGRFTNSGLSVTGSISASADVVAYVSSDKRLKDNIKNIANPLEKLNKLNGIEFDWNDKQDLYKGHDIGVIAQEVEEVLPEIVDTREDGHKAVKYDRMVALLIEAVKEQQQQIDELRKGNFVIETGD